MRKATQPTAALRPHHLNLETRHCKWRTRLVPAALCLLAGGLVLSPVTSPAPTGSWSLNNNGTWSNTNNWTGGVVADGAGFAANFNKINISANRTVTLDSSRTIGSVAIADSSGNQLYTITPSGGSVLTLDNGASKPIISSVQPNPGHAVNVVLAGTNGFRGPQAQDGVLSLGAANIYTGDTEISRGFLLINNPLAIPSGAGYGNVMLMANVGNPGNYPRLDLNAFSITINGLNADFDPVANTNYLNPPLVLSTSGTAGISTLTVGNANSNGVFGGIIQDGTSRTLALTKIGTGTQTLTNGNTYTGSTIINGGTLKLQYGGGIVNSTKITVGPGATFDVSGVPTPPYALGNSQTLGGSGATGTIAGDLSLAAGGPLALTYTASTPTLTTSGTLTLNANPTTINIAGALNSGSSYTLITKSGGGTVAGPAGTPSFTGDGIHGNGTPALAVSGGELVLNIGAATGANLHWGTGNGTWAVGTAGWNAGGTTAYADGDSVSFTDVDAIGNPTITLDTTVTPGDFTVNSTKHYTISGTGSINGIMAATKDGSGTLTLAVNNGYTTRTTISAGTLELGNGGAVGNLTGDIADNAALVFNRSDTWSYTGLISGSGTVAMAGTGSLTLSPGNTYTGKTLISQGTVSVSADSCVGAVPSVTTADQLTLNGGTISYTATVNPVPANRGITVGASGGTIEIAGAFGVYYANGVVSGPGVLTVRSTSGVGTLNEFRTYGSGGVNPAPTNTFSKLVVDNAMFTAGSSGSGGGDVSFGAVPTSFMADNITLQNGGAVRISMSPGITLNANRGITLGSGGGHLRSLSTYVLTIPGVITGSDSLTINPHTSDTGTITLTGANTYTGPTTVTRGTLRVDSPGSLAAGSTVMVNAGATLGGSGTINGPVTVNGAIGAGSSAGLLTLTNGLDLSITGTNVWELAANSTANPGTDFDQLAITGGTLTLGGSSTLSIKFIGTATAPNLNNTFWQYPRQWKVIALSGGAGITGDFTTIIGTNGITAGTFTTTTDSSGVTLVYAPVSSPVTSFSITPGPGVGQMTLGYSGGIGSNFVLLQTNNVAAPLTNWTRLLTNTSTPGSFTITPGSDPQEFYKIKSE
jgi:fibronectin-binding autotransporter adhesin